MAREHLATSLGDLRQSHAKHERLVDNLVETFLYRHDVQGVFNYVSSSVTQVLGYTAEEFLTHFTEYLTDHPANREVVKHTEQSVNGVQQPPYEVQTCHKDGGIRWLEVSETPVRGGSGKVVAVEGVAHDITERKRAEEALRESEAKYRTFFENSGDAMLMISNYKFVDCNAATVAMLGHDNKEDLLNTHPSELSPEFQPDGKKSFDKAVQMMETAFAKGTHRFEWDHKRKNGEVFPVEVSLTAIPLEGEIVLHTVWRDITERKRAEEEREMLESQLRQSQKMEAVGQLAGGVAHDFNNLLQVILGYGEIALEDMKEDGGVREWLKGIMKAADRARVLVRQLLAFSRRQVLELEVLDLREVVGDLTKMIRRVIGEHISLNTHSGPDAVVVRADRGQMEQILMNLCVNARDEMVDGGEIDIETSSVELDEKYCELHSWAQPGRYAMLSVSDTGGGMDEETRQRVFEPFFTTKEMGKGTGLGLSTVYGIVKQHNGLIHVYSELGEGTRFRIYLPLAEGMARAQEAVETGPPPGGTETILLAEDDEMVRELCEETLGKAGYTVLTACDGEEAVRLFDLHAGKIDMALLDVVMPKLGGEAVFNHIREKRPDVRVLFASGYSSNAIHTNFVLDEGMELIQKPYHRDELLRKARETLDADANPG